MDTLRERCGEGGCAGSDRRSPMTSSWRRSTQRSALVVVMTCRGGLRPWLGQIATNFISRHHRSEMPGLQSWPCTTGLIFFDPLFDDVGVSESSPQVNTPARALVVWCPDWPV